MIELPLTLVVPRIVPCTLTVPAAPERTSPFTTLPARSDTVPPDRAMIVDVLIFPVPVIQTVGEPESDRFVTQEDIHPDAEPPILSVPVALPKKLKVATLLIVTIPPNVADV